MENGQSGPGRRSESSPGPAGPAGPGWKWDPMDGPMGRGEIGSRWMGQRAEARWGAEDGGKGSETQRRSSEVMAELVGAD